MPSPDAVSDRRRTTLAALAISLLLAGCAPRPVPVARVGTETISVDQFQDAARGNEAQYQGVPDSAKTALLEDLMRRSLLIQEARRRHLIPDTTLQRLRTQEGHKLAVDRLIEILVPKNVPVSDAEVAAFYKRREVEAHMALVFVPTKQQADAAKAELSSGASFEAVANKYNPPRMLPPGGDLGFQTPGSLLEPLDQYLYEGPLNQVLGPDEIKGQGWAIAKVTERRPHQQESLDAQKATLKSMIMQRKQRDLQQKAYLDLKSQYHVRLEEGAAQAVFMHFNHPGADSTSPALVLARYDGEGGKPATYTFAEALDDLQDAEQQRPDLSSLPIVQHWIELEAIRRVSQIEALRRHLNEDPVVKRRVEERVNNRMLERIYEEEVASRIAPASPEEIQAAYARRAAAFQRVDAAKVRTLTVPDSAAALALVEHAGHGTTPDLRELAGMLPAKLKASARVVEREVKFPSSDPTWSEMQPVFGSLKPGDLRGPVKAPGGWMFFELVSKSESTTAFDKLSPQIQHALEQEALEQKRDKRLSAYTDSLRASAKIEIYRDRLKKIPWPVPRAEPTS